MGPQGSENFWLDACCGLADLLRADLPLENRGYSLLTKKLAERTGLEPATPGVTGRYSNQLNYRSNFGGC